MPIPQFNKKNVEPWRNSGHNETKKRNKPKKTFKKKLISAVLALAAIGFLFFIALFLWVSRDLPNPNQLMNREVAQSTKIYDRTGKTVIYEISGEQRRTLVLLKDIPDYVKEATIAIEDKNFYKHGGFSLWAMFRTAITNVIYHRSAGGSTLTQQFLKNAVLSSEKTLTRKAKELILAYRLEKKFTKDEILQMYLNEIPYGSNAYGIEAASTKYFGKPARELSLAEAAVLAALPQSPSRYSPYGENKDLLLGRKDYILDLMEERGYISAAERDEAKKQVIQFKGRDNNMIAPHFVMYIKGILSDKYGEKMIEQEGLKIYTTLDLDKQNIAEEVITARTASYPKNYGANNAALVAIDPKTGQILAMVGSRDYFDDSIDGQVNVATRPRQPGSSMKPIVYAALFERGYSPNTILYDVVTNFSTNPAEPYEPHNYNGLEYGPVKIRQALAGSLNIPAVKAIYLAGINNVIDLAENLGYTTLYPRNRFGLALVLGGAEVKLLEHTNAYSAFARDGKLSQPTGILKIEDKNGKILEEYQPTEKKALDSNVARMINSVLSDNAARSFIFTSKNFLTLGDRPVAAKTGTTNDYHDAWTIGYTPSLVAGVWVGNSDNKAMTGKADGSVVAAPIWHDFMSKALNGTPVETFKAPDDYKAGKAILDGQIPSQTVKIDKSSGLLATSSTPPELIDEQIIKTNHSILFYVDKDNPLGQAPSNPAKDPQFNLWESAVKKWADKHASSTPTTLPTSYDELHKPENKPIIKIISPAKNQTLSSKTLEIQIEASAPRGINRSEYYINGNLWETKWGEPSVFSKDIPSLSNGYQNLKIRVCDDVENCSEDEINFNLLIKNNQAPTEKNFIKITAPAPASTFGSINFPLALDLQVGQAESVSKINLIARGADGKTETIKSFSIPNNKNIKTSWESAPLPGKYFLYAELLGWNGTTEKSNEVELTIN